MEDKPNIIPLVDENGVTTNYAIIALLEETGSRYVLLEKLPAMDKNVADLFILELFTDENGKEYLTQIEDAARYEKIMQTFREKLTQGVKDKYEQLKQ